MMIFLYFDDIFMVAVIWSYIGDSVKMTSCMFHGSYWVTPVLLDSNFFPTLFHQTLII